MTPPPSTGPLLFAIAAGTASVASARVGDEELTFVQLGELARAHAGDLRARHVRCLAVLSEPTMATLVAVSAGLLAGVPVVPIPPDAGAAELAYQLDDCGADAWAGPGRAGVGLPVIPVRTKGEGTGRFAESTELALPAADPRSPAMVLYTSGTTGAPKGVVLTAAAIAADIDALADAWAWTDADTLAHGLPLFHVHGLVIGCLGPLRVGSGLIHVGKPTPQAYAAARRASPRPATMYFGVPTIWHRIAGDERAARELAGARILISGSAPLPVPVFERMRELTGHEMVERYGMTETLLTVSNRVDRPRLPGHVGWPVAGVDTRLRDEHGIDVPHDGESVGRLEVRGATLFNGYLGREDATAASYTLDGWFVTGDVATIDADGNHRIVGRESVDLIKSGGYRVGAGELETHLLGKPGVAEVAIVGVPDDDLGQRIVAYVVPTPDDAGARLDVDALARSVADGLSVHKRPREVYLVSSLPRNEMGKVQKMALLTAYEDRRS
ncbi:MAG: AMP-binding protein [Dermatophilaceae bacterium]